SEPAAWLFHARRRQPLTRDALAAAELAWQPLASVRLSVAQFSRAGQWHLAPGAALGPSGRSAMDASAWACARACRAAARGQEPRVREAGLLDGVDLCAGCVASLTVPGPEGTYASLAWWILAAQDWVVTLELAASSADWLACARWTASTPFTEPCPIP